MKRYKINFLGNKLKLNSLTNVKCNIHEGPNDIVNEDLKFYNDNSDEIDLIFNNKDEEIYNVIFKKNTLDYLIQDELKEEMISVKMSHNLRESIIESTINKPKSVYEKLFDFLNLTVEIPVSYVCTICIVLFISSTLSTFIVTDNMKTDKKLQGYTNIRVLNISGSNVILPKDMREVIVNEKN